MCIRDSDDDDLIGKWYRVSDMDGLARNYASSFTIGNKGYLICGNDGKNRLSDCWEYDMERDTWTQKADFPGTARNSAVAMAVDEKGYLGTGYDGTNYLNDFWEFNPTTNTWAQKADFPGSGRYGAVAFGVNGKAYIGCGYDGNYLKAVSYTHLDVYKRQTGCLPERTSRSPTARNISRSRFLYLINPFTHESSYYRR